MHAQSGEGMNLKIRMKALIVLAVLLAGGGVQAAEVKYPQRPVRMLVSYPPGGPSDLTARLAAPHLFEVLGQQFIQVPAPAGGATLAVIQRIEFEQPTGQVAQPVYDRRTVEL